MILNVFEPHLLKARGHFNRACKRKGETDNRSCACLVRDERELSLDAALGSLDFFSLPDAARLGEPQTLACLTQGNQRTG